MERTLFANGLTFMHGMPYDGTYVAVKKTVQIESRRRNMHSFAFVFYCLFVCFGGCVTFYFFTVLLTNIKFKCFFFSTWTSNGWVSKKQKYFIHVKKKVRNFGHKEECEMGEWFHLIITQNFITNAYLRSITEALIGIEHETHWNMKR